MKGPWPIRVVHGGAKLIERVVYGKKIFHMPSALEKHLNRPKFCYPFGVIVTDIAKIMLFLAIFNSLFTKHSFIFTCISSDVSWDWIQKERGILLTFALS